MRQARWLAFILLLFLLGGMLPACEEEKEDKPSLGEWIERGKEYLSQGDGARAYLAFREALKIRGGDLQARYGIILADVLQFVDTAELVVTLFSGQTDADISEQEASAVCQQLDSCGLLDRLEMDYQTCLATGVYAYDDKTRECIVAAADCELLFDRCFGMMLPPDRETCAEACVRFSSCGYLLAPDFRVAECIDQCPQLYYAGELACFMAADDCETGREKCFAHVGDTVGELISEFWAPIREEMSYDIEALKDHPDFLFELDYYSVALLDPFLHPVFSGYHDESDLYFFASVFSGMDAIFYLFEGLNLDVNPILLAGLGLSASGGAINLFANETEDEWWDEIADWLTEADALIATILNDPIYREALTLDEEEGADNVEQSGTQIGMIFGNIAKLIEMVAAETDDQSDEVIRYVDENGDGRWNDPEPLIIPGVVEMDYRLAWIVHDICRALKVDFADGYPFHLEELNPLFNYLDLHFLTALIDLLDLAGVDAVDLGQAFREPTSAGLRPALEWVREAIQLLQSVIAEL
ncbi:MAG: hypothetical protein GX444_06575 [Myxococcales bacterium]|nr:hypothetical protein [Myxococcales bacterium]